MKTPKIFNRGRPATQAEYETADLDIENWNIYMIRGNVLISNYFSEFAEIWFDNVATRYQGAHQAQTASPADGVRGRNNERYHTETVHLRLSAVNIRWRDFLWRGRSSISFGPQRIHDGEF